MLVAAPAKKMLAAALDEMLCLERCQIQTRAWSCVADTFDSSFCRRVWGRTTGFGAEPQGYIKI